MDLLPRLSPMEISEEERQRIEAKWQAIREEPKRVRMLLEIALANLKEAMSSELWSYTKEYELGKLDVAKAILSSAIQELDE